MSTSFHYQSTCVEEDSAYLDLTMPNVVADDFSFAPQSNTSPAANCGSINLSQLDESISFDNVLWDHFNPDLLGLSTESSIHPSTAPLNDIWSTDFNSLPDPSSICFDTPQMGYASPTFFSADADTNSTDPTLPSPNSDDSIQRLNWVRSTLKDLALARAAKDTRPVSQKTKQMDASIELYLQLQNDLSSGFQEECAPAAQSMVWQPSSTTISDSSFDNNSFSLTGSPGSSTGTVPELSPASITRVGSASAGPSRPTPLPASGGVQMVLDMNLNETTSLPRKHRPKTQEERQRYIAVRRQGACEWHRKQRKRCTCVDKTNSALTTAKRKKLMKHVQTSQQHCSSAVTPASAGDRWRRTNVRPCSGPLRSSPTPQVCLIPKSTWRCDGALSCTDPECLECCGNEEPIAQRLQVVVQSSVDCQRHKPYINRGTLELIEWQPWGEPSDDHRRYTLLPPVRESLEPASQAQRAIQSRLQTTTVPGSVRAAQDLDIHTIASPGRAYSSRDLQYSRDNLGDRPTCLHPTNINITSTHASIRDSRPNSHLLVRCSDKLGIDVGAISTDGQRSTRSPHAQIDNQPWEPTTRAVLEIVVRLMSGTILRLATCPSSIFSRSSASWQLSASSGKWEIQHAIRNKKPSHSEAGEPSTAITCLLMILGFSFVSPTLSIVASIFLYRATRCSPSSSNLAHARQIISHKSPTVPDHRIARTHCAVK
ncbi:conserved hypothetical protein [Histoplasma capsulatum var. duboisii H88]|uniref:Uncharacterized protein n=1 Tax=Ajellomyces capsulatus (strain H88) TaxID=544711 RepID=F0UGU5_AJEC8|nr:conserved hypothetical protein [Histoplasma capsulatum var. duboisii H88]QSS55953.1 hypothetical protein I7I53_03984 [Histoplasma capsulatum var. duboisii H88]